MHCRGLCKLWCIYATDLWHLDKTLSPSPHNTTRKPVNIFFNPQMCFLYLSITLTHSLINNTSCSWHLHVNVVWWNKVPNNKYSLSKICGPFLECGNNISLTLPRTSKGTYLECVRKGRLLGCDLKQNICLICKWGHSPCQNLKLRESQ